MDMQAPGEKNVEGSVLATEAAPSSPTRQEALKDIKASLPAHLQGIEPGHDVVVNGSKGLGGARVRVPAEQRNAIIIAVIEEMVEDGMGLREAADKHGLAHETVRAWLLSEVPEQYKAIQQAGLIAKIIDADNKLEGATDHISVSKYAHGARNARWDAERRLPRLFGPKQEITGAGGGPIQHMDVTETARRLAYLTEEARANNAIDVTPGTAASST